MSESIPEALGRTAPRWLIGVYAVLAASSVVSFVSALIGSATAVNVALFTGVGALVAWVIGYFRIRRPDLRETEFRNHWTMAGWFITDMASSSMLAGYPHASVLWPAIAAAAGVAAAGYGVVCEAVR